MEGKQKILERNLTPLGHRRNVIIEILSFLTKENHKFFNIDPYYFNSNISELHEPYKNITRLEENERYNFPDLTRLKVPKISRT